MAYDQPLKDLLRPFFAEFLTSFFPTAAARLDLDTIIFLEKEATTDLLRGRRREMDLVAQVARRDGTTTLVIVLVELQARPEGEFPWRLFEYYTLLRRVYRLPVLPIVVYVRGGRGSKLWEEYREELFEELTVLFRYRRPRLKGLKAAAAVRQGGPLVGALAALMDRRGADPVELKVASLERIGAGRLDEARRWLLSSFVEQFLPLPTAEEQRFRQLTNQEEHQMAKLADYEAWRTEQWLQAKRQDVLTVLRTRFAPVPEEWERRVEAMASLAELDALLVRLLKANHLAEVQ
jgi:hypothetical protein